MSNGNTRSFEFPAAQTLGPKASDVRLESGTIESLSDFGHLPLAASKIQFAGH
jgi:hypothetical protein